VIQEAGVLGQMLVYVLLLRNVQITQSQLQLMLLNVILKIQLVFQEQLQDQQFHAQQEQFYAQMLKIKMFAQD
jgi:hypothetical protein